ncbi:inorganic phosphate transporter [Patescibacteria group bacterium]|nr:inorganic phosphate transporter [Patescibacteria group bacterium]
MQISFEFLAVICLILLACGNLIVGVVNDAVNFLSSAVGAKVAPTKVIMIVASLGVICGATFSDGIIEVARKGIFTPSYFTLNEAIIIFTAVALADIILLDIFSSFGLPTSTTVSVVFELFGSALVFALWKMGSFSEAWEVINASSALKIISGILFSVVIAFFVGLVAQFITRLFFTFNYHKTLRRWGFLWTGAALSFLTFYVLLIGGKHASFMTPEMNAWISSNSIGILVGGFVGFSLLSFVLIRLKVKILKIIILLGTGALAMAFAGNDLANFIGVSVAGTHAFLGSDLSRTLPTPTWVLVIAGLILSVTIFVSKKARTVINTSINLTSHKKNVVSQWKSNFVLEGIVNLVGYVFSFVPKRIRNWIAIRWESDGKDKDHAFDKVRACVNLIVSAALISYATSQKLPLSTTYVTFMVAMGTALADGAWGKESASNRIMGVITVIAGWFFTAFAAFTFAGITVSVLYLTRIYGLVILMSFVTFTLYKLHHFHAKRILDKV